MILSSIQDDPTELDEYVHMDDGYWSWEVIGEERYQYVTVYHINMTSQRWMAHDGKSFWIHESGISGGLLSYMIKY